MSRLAVEHDINVYKRINEGLVSSKRELITLWRTYAAMIASAESVLSRRLVCGTLPHPTDATQTYSPSCCLLAYIILKLMIALHVSQTQRHLVTTTRIRAPVNNNPLIANLH